MAAAIKKPSTSTTSGLVVRRQVVSKPGAAIRLTEISLSKYAQSSLKVNLKSIPSK